MRHKMLTQRNPFCHHVNAKRAAFRDACLILYWAVLYDYLVSVAITAIQNTVLYDQYCLAPLP
jgi:hypothetical protein